MTWRAVFNFGANLVRVRVGIFSTQHHTMLAAVCDNLNPPAKLSSRDAVRAWQVAVMGQGGEHHVCAGRGTVVGKRWQARC